MEDAMIIERVVLVVVKDEKGTRVSTLTVGDAPIPGLTPGRIHATLLEAAGTIPIEDRNK